jgi:hypothetical protein
MRLTFAMCVCVLLPAIATCQTGNDPEHVIRRMIDSGGFEGHDQKVIGPMGEAAAVLVTKILAGRNLSSKDIDMALLVLEGSFADPSFVKLEADREPKTALFVLKCFDSSTNDPALKKRIAEAREYMQQRYAKFIQGNSRNN